MPDSLPADSPADAPAPAPAASDADPDAVASFLAKRGKAHLEKRSLNWTQGDAPLPDRRAFPASNVSIADDLALQLAHTLDDLANLPYYDVIIQNMIRGKILSKFPPVHRHLMLLQKARQLMSLRQPWGPIRNPAAVFVTWVRHHR